jgi:endonuclease YncB( thermonuclease family)
MIRLLTILALLAAAAPAAAADTYLGGAIATDGDSLVLNGQRIRLYGVDAFEAEQTCTAPSGRAFACGGAATRALAEKIKDAHVVCFKRTQDDYGRIVGQCRANETDLGAYMVRRGHALAYRRYSAAYEVDEAQAKAARLGVWAVGSKFQTPWDWRAARRETGAPLAAAPSRTQQAVGGACEIKGNITAKGERIYHTRASRIWARTRAEAIFCSVEEAEAAGFRAPRG